MKTCEGHGDFLYTNILLAVSSHVSHQGRWETGRRCASPAGGPPSPVIVWEEAGGCEALCAFRRSVTCITGATTRLHGIMVATSARAEEGGSILAHRATCRTYHRAPPRLSMLSRVRQFGKGGRRRRKKEGFQHGGHSGARGMAQLTANLPLPHHSAHTTCLGTSPLPIDDRAVSAWKKKNLDHSSALRLRPMGHNTGKGREAPWRAEGGTCISPSGPIAMLNISDKLPLTAHCLGQEAPSAFSPWTTIILWRVTWERGMGRAVRRKDFSGRTGRRKGKLSGHQM